MNLLNKKIGDILNNFPSSKNFFDKYKIDFCCGGQKKLKDALIELNINNDKVLDELYNEIKHTKINDSHKDEILKSIDISSKPSNEIINFIINHFHEGLLRDLPEINKLMLKIMRVHINKHKELFWKIHELVGKIQVLMDSHLILEEENIFKAMISLESNQINRESQEYKIMISSINESINEHSIVGPCLKELSDATNNYTPPQDACNTVKKVYSDLKKLQDHLIAHTQLENNVLFPRFYE
ncbi:DUF542 domain-containing protein [Candidatus Arthromitus sp. SFB-rat-Yit]|uniref:DUF542 domain-containing protein n=1 Tax=Candidatus Arthromitus sp. SFB-rat-Yit TaxID=1041504 RepID=UPI000227A46A|nr:DUF542 domain-containing protein [Candidatus Arthromitus sp. SFB-rat-Yit]BAK80941.1 putative ScdA protein [Candidatus Arthromitus sp. SFB-rat-Yit]